MPKEYGFVPRFYSWGIKSGIATTKVAKKRKNRKKKKNLKKGG